MYFSSELNAVHEFVKNDAAWLNSVADDPEVPTLAVLADAIGSAAANFGLCEIYDRKAGRGEALEQGKERVRHYKKMSDRYQQRGLAVLERAISQLPNFEAELSSIRKRPARAVAAKRASEARDDFLLWFSESELKVADMKKLEKALAEATTAVLEGPESFGKHVSAKLTELQKARKSDDRGNRDNIPWWKIVLIALYLLVSLWKIIRCIILDRCSKAEKAIVEAAAAILGVSLKFC